MVQPGVDFDEAELETARRALSKGKALGIDYLPDKFFKNQFIWDRIKERILGIFNVWATGQVSPNYLNIAQIVPLSKEKDAPLFPAVGNVRTIAVLPSIAKLFELCILQRLQSWAKENEIIHAN